STDHSTTQHYPLSLHDALPISSLDQEGANAHPPSAHIEPTVTGKRVVDQASSQWAGCHSQAARHCRSADDGAHHPEREILTRERSEEHTSELQSPDHLVCRLLL